MKFYNRLNELKTLRLNLESSKKSSRMTVITGRRRIGKTKLILEAFKDDLIYLFAARKDEKLLCEEFTFLIQNKLNKKIIGKIASFKDLFEYLMILSEEKNITVAIDEFQEFYNINPLIYSDMQNIWDTYKDKSKINLILSGSVYSLMKKTFENSNEPLFGRADKKIYLKPFDIGTLKEIMIENTVSLDKKDLFSFYIFTGGIAKYVEIFVDSGDLTYDKMLENILEENSIFLNEGKDLLIEEFGKEYAVYFSILSLIANSKTSRSEIESILEKNIGGYLDRLENEYNIIKRVKPIFAKEGGRIQKYVIEDNFLNFWFRFIYGYRSAIEIGNLKYVKDIVNRDFNTYSGYFLEKYFIEKLKLSDKFSNIGTYWEKGNNNEIDIVAVNDIEKKILICEVKLNPQKINLNKLKEKSEKLIEKFKEYSFEYKGFSLDDL
ncbi:MAG: ATP-binding protein [bacterium]